MYDRQTILSLAVGLMVALIVCVLVLPTAGRAWLLSAPDSDLPHLVQTHESDTEKEPVRPRPSAKRNRVRLGDDEKHVARVAWISYDDYQQLMAPSARTIQPALQNNAQPTPRAPHRLDATDPAPVPRESVQPSALESAADAALAAKLDPTAQAVQTPVAGRRQPPMPKLETVPDAMLARAAAGLKSYQAPKPAESTGLPQDQPHKMATRPDKLQAPQGATPAPSQPRHSLPTASPRSDHEASPVTLATDAKQVRAGRVITAQGVKIKTVAPRISAVTYLTTMRGGVRVPVLVVFNKHGRVTRAKLTSCSGYPEVDTPIRTSLYRWTATGKKLVEIDGPFQVEIDVNLRVRLR